MDIEGQDHFQDKFQGNVPFYLLADFLDTAFRPIFYV